MIKIKQQKNIAENVKSQKKRAIRKMEHILNTSWLLIVESYKFNMSAAGVCLDLEPRTQFFQPQNTWNEMVPDDRLFVSRQMDKARRSASLQLEIYYKFCEVDGSFS